MRLFATLCLGCSLVLGLPTLTHAQEFMAYEGRNATFNGEGGERRTVDGIDMWLRGTPPHRFVVLGSITDRRHKTGLFGMVRMAMFDGDIARLTKSAGGDAVILREQRDDVVGAVGSTFGSVQYGGFNSTFNSSSIATTIEKRQSEFLVIRYLPDEPESSPAVASSSPMTVYRGPPLAPPPLAAIPSRVQASPYPAGHTALAYFQTPYVGSATMPSGSAQQDPYARVTHIVVH
jgi:hypothetical protein